MANNNTKEESKNLVIPAKQQSAVASNNVDTDVMNLLEANAGSGLENITREDTSIPFLGLLQDLSPQVKRTEAAFIDGAQAGMFIDGSMKEIFDGTTGILAIPLLFEKVYNVFRNRKAGGGFFGSFKTRADAEKRIAELGQNADATKKIASDVLEIVDTGLHYLLYQVPSSGMWRRAVLSCKSTMLKPSRSWNLKMEQLELPRAKGVGTFTPPSWGTIYHLTSQVQRKDQNAWFVFDVTFVGLVSDKELLAKSAALYKSLTAGDVKVDFSKDDDVAASVESVATPASTASNSSRPAF